MIFRENSQTDEPLGKSLSDLMEDPIDAVKIENFQNHQQVVTTRSHAWIADEPLPDGDGLGSNPYELLLAALGT